MPDHILTRLEVALDLLLWQQLEVLADYHEEAGNVLLAGAYRYLASNHLAPLRYSERWHWRRMGAEQLPLGHQLPVDVLFSMLSMPDRIGLDWNESQTMSAAYQRAALAIVASRILEDSLPIPEES